MAIRVKDAATAAKKFADRGAAAGPDYAAGVQGAGSAWQQNTAAAADTFAHGVTEAIARNAFAKGVNAAGGSKYEQRASGIGAQRFGQGVRAAQGSYEQGVAPYLQTIASLTLPPRRPKGDPANFERSQAVGLALRRRKVGG